MSDFKFSVNTNALKSKYSVQEIAELCARTGAEGIEWGLSGLDNAAADAKAMRQASKDTGMEVMGFLNAGRLWETDNIRKWSEAVAGTPGITLRVAHPWFAFSFNEALHQRESFLQLVSRARKGLENLIPLAREYGIKYVLELHSGSIAASPWAIRELMKDLPPECVGAIYDPANTTMEGFVRPSGACDLMGAHMAYVHAKNICFVPAGTTTEIAFPRRMQWRYEKALLDRGMTDFVEVFFALKNCGYKGWISLEEFIGPDVEREIADGIKFLKECAAAAPSTVMEPFSTFND